MKNSNEQMRKAIREALDSYHITQQAAVDDTGFFLVDALTPSWETSIEKGQLELDSLADHIFFALPPETTHASIAEKYKGLVEAAWEVIAQYDKNGDGWELHVITKLAQALAKLEQE